MHKLHMFCMELVHCTLSRSELRDTVLAIF